MLRRIGLPIAIIVVGFGLAAALLRTGPSISPQAPVAESPLVRAVTVQPADFEFEATARGTVMPRSETELIAEVSGRVIELSQSLVTGGFFKEDDVLLRIDPLDYEIALEQASAQVQRASLDASPPDILMLLVGLRCNFAQRALGLTVPFHPKRTFFVAACREPLAALVRRNPGRRLARQPMTTHGCAPC